MNTNTKNGSFHAEVNCLQSYYKFNKAAYLGVPVNARLYSTLQPCEMCSGMIWESLADQTKARVYYGMVDPAQLKTGTKLHATNTERLLSQWQAVSYYDASKNENKKSTVPSGPSAIKTYQHEQTVGPNAYKLIQEDYSHYLEQTKTGSQLSAADFMTARKSPVLPSLSNVTDTLQRKVQKYNDNPKNKILNPNVKKVVSHVHEFLKHKGIQGF